MRSYFCAQHHQNPTVTSVPSGQLYTCVLEAVQRPVMLLTGWIMSTTPARVVIPVQGPCLLRLWGLSDQCPLLPPPPNPLVCSGKVWICAATARRVDSPFPVLFTGAVTTTSVAFLLVPQFGKWHASCGSEIAVGDLRFYQRMHIWK